MKRSLLAVMAIMPTLLIGCKTKKLKEIIFSVPQIEFSDIGTLETVELDPRPSGIKINFEEVKWSGIENAGRTSIEVKDYVSITLTQDTPEKEGGLVLGFTLVKALPGEKGITVTATYKEFDKNLTILSKK